MVARILRKRRERRLEVLVRSGMILCRAERYTEALAFFEKALRHDGTNPVLWNNKGFCLAQLGRYREACDAYRSALAGEETDKVEAWSNLAATLVWMGSYGEALHYFNLALAVRPEDPLLLNNAAMCLEKLGRREEALRCYEGALARDPGNTTYLLNKGVCLTKLGRWGEAARCFEEVLRRDPGNRIAREELEKARTNLEHFQGRFGAGEAK